MVGEHNAGRRAWATPVVDSKQKEATQTDDCLDAIMDSPHLIIDLQLAIEQGEEYVISLKELRGLLQKLRLQCEALQESEQVQRLLYLDGHLRLEEHRQFDRLRLLREIEGLQGKHHHRRQLDFPHLEESELYQKLLDLQQHQERAWAEREQLLREFWRIRDQEKLRQHVTIQKVQNPFHQLQEQRPIQQPSSQPLLQSGTPCHQGDISSSEPLMVSSLPFIVFMILFGPKFLRGCWSCTCWAKRGVETAVRKLCGYSVHLDFKNPSARADIEWPLSSVLYAHSTVCLMLRCVTRVVVSLWKGICNLSAITITSCNQTFATLFGRQTEALRTEISRQDTRLRDQQLQINSLTHKMNVIQERYHRHDTSIIKTSSQLLGLTGRFTEMTQRLHTIVSFKERFEGVYGDFKDQKQTVASLEKDVKNLQRRKDWMASSYNRDHRLQPKHIVAADPKPSGEEEIHVLSIEETATLLEEQISIHERYMTDSICTMEKQLTAQQAVLGRNEGKLQQLHTLLATKSADPPGAQLGAEEIKELLEKKFKAVVIQSKNKFDVHEARIAALEKAVYKPDQQTLPVEDRLENLEYDVGNALAQLKELTIPTSETVDGISVLRDRLDHLRQDMKNVVKKAFEAIAPDALASMIWEIGNLHGRTKTLEEHDKNASTKSAEFEQRIAAINTEVEQIRSRLQHLFSQQAGSLAALDYSVKQNQLNVSVNYLQLKQQVDWLKDDVHTLDMHVAERLQLIDIFLSQVEGTPAERLLLAPALKADGTPDLEDGPLFPRPTTASSDSVGKMHRTTQVDPPALLPYNQRLPAADTVQEEESTSVLRLTTSSDLVGEMRHTTVNTPPGHLPNNQRPTASDTVYVGASTSGDEDTDSSMHRDTISDSLQGDVGDLTARYLAAKNTFKAASFACSSIGRKGSAEIGGDRLEFTNTSSTDQFQNSLGSSTGEAAILNDHRDEGLGHHLKPEPSIGNSSQDYLESAAALSLSSTSTSSSQFSPMSTTSDELPVNALIAVTVNKHGASLRSPLTVQHQVRPSIDKHETLSFENFERFQEEIEERLTALEDNFRSNYGTQAAFITDIPTLDLHPAPPEPNVRLGCKTMVEALKASMADLQNTSFRANSRVVLHEIEVKQLLDEKEARLKDRFGAISIAQTATQTNIQNLQNSIRNIKRRLHQLQETLRHQGGRERPFPPPPTA